MSQFHREKIGMFLGIVRKYMQMRGGLSQKDLSDITEVGVSTMSRFLNQKTADINPQLVAKIVAKLEIPLHEMIDFVEEGYADRFIRLVKFYKNDGEEDTATRKDDDITPQEAVAMRTGAVSADEEDGGDELDDLAAALGPSGTAQRSAKGNISVGGKKRTIAFHPDHDAPHSTSSLKEKLASLSPRQKAYMTDFLNLDVESRDLIVDLGNSLFRYFKQKGMEF